MFNKTGYARLPLTSDLESTQAKDAGRSRLKMPAPPCAVCQTSRALIVRPKNHQKLCKACFLHVFEAEIHHTITANALFHRGERIAIGASGGKDSTVLASVLKTLNERHGYGLDLVLLSIDEGIKGYRDDSLETVKRNAVQYAMRLEIVGYDELYGWTMDQVVDQVGKKGNCTYCGVFRRQALDRGAAKLDVKHVVTGHNADDMAETVMMNRECSALCQDLRGRWLTVEGQYYGEICPDLHAPLASSRSQRARRSRDPSRSSMPMRRRLCCTRITRGWITFLQSAYTRPRLSEARPGL